MIGIDKDDVYSNNVIIIIIAILILKTKNGAIN